MTDVFRLVATAVTTTNTFTLFTVDTAATAIIRNITICNAATAGTVACDVLVKPISQNDVYLFRVTQVTAQQTVQPTDAALIVGPGGSLRVAVSTANAVHVTASYLETE